MSRDLENVSSDNAKKNLTESGGERLPPYGSVQIMFYVADPTGRRLHFCREPGTQHGFNTYEEALSWVEVNKHRAFHGVVAFRVEIWP